MAVAAAWAGRRRAISSIPTGTGRADTEEMLKQAEVAEVLRWASDEFGEGSNDSDCGTRNRLDGWG